MLRGRRAPLAETPELCLGDVALLICGRNFLGELRRTELQVLESGFPFLVFFACPLDLSEGPRALMRRCVMYDPLPAGPGWLASPTRCTRNP